MKPTQMIVGFVRRHAVILLVLVVVFSAFAAWGVTQISVVTTQDTFLSAESEAFKGHRAYEDAFGGDDAFQGHHLAGVVGAREAGQQVAVDQAAREAHAHPYSGPGDLVEFRRDQVVEVAVEVRRRQQREHPGDRVSRCCRWIVRCHAGGGYYRPTAARSLSARSVFSQGASMSVRPKWP